MDRCAVFVDAGHLLAEGGKLCCGTAARTRFQCDYTGLINALARFATSHCGLSILRIYWYDAAPEAIPTQEQLAIAELTSVKLRLGRLVSGKQKGVDSLIVRDLMTLARERAVTTVFLLGGDEDLREGVVAAQEMGVLVVVLGIPAVGIGNQAMSLIRESDEHIVLDAPFLSHFFSSRAVHPQIPLPLQTPVGQEAARLAGESFATEWAKRATADEIQRLLDQAPILPNQLDRELLATAEETLGSLQEQKSLRRDLRAGFWHALQSLTASQPT
jgi:NYN domain